MTSSYMLYSLHLYHKSELRDNMGKTKKGREATTVIISSVLGAASIYYSVIRDIVVGNV